MQFVSYLDENKESIGVLLDDKVIPLLPNFGIKVFSMIRFIEMANNRVIEQMEEILAEEKYDFLPLNSVKLLAPIPYPHRNVFCLGKNYADHITEIASQIANADIPTVPNYFTKIASPAIGHHDDISYSAKVTNQVDYEVELAVIIGAEGKDIARENAEKHIFGYTIVNDISARDMQAAHNQWFKGKSLDSFCSMGPVIVHKKEIPLPVELDIQCYVNGELRQNSHTSKMIFDIPSIISDLSKGMTLKTGDIICTGTPRGVGMGFSPPKFLQDGDIVECRIQKIGKLVNRVSVTGDF